MKREIKSSARKLHNTKYPNGREEKVHRSRSNVHVCSLVYVQSGAYTTVRRSAMLLLLPSVYKCELEKTRRRTTEEKTYTKYYNRSLTS